MPGRSLSVLLDAYRDKLNKHTAEIRDTQAKIESLEAAVAKLEAKVAKDDESSGLRAALTDWGERIRELL